MDYGLKVGLHQARPDDLPELGPPLELVAVDRPGRNGPGLLDPSINEPLDAEHWLAAQHRIPAADLHFGRELFGNTVTDCAVNLPRDPACHGFQVAEAEVRPQ